MKRWWLIVPLLSGCVAAAPAPSVPEVPRLADADADGIPDALDACPGAAEDGVGPADRDGCPVDGDGDGVLGLADACPKEPETLNGFEDADGCPDEAPVAAAPRPKMLLPIRKVRITTRRIEIDEKVHFATGRADIEPTSFGLLDEVAQTLTEHDELDFLEISGHADVRGNARSNLDLTRARSEAVRRALIERGVSETRLRAAGYGAYCPIDPGQGEEAWAKNRRVEFNILRRAGSDLDPGWGGCDGAKVAGITPQAIPDTAPRTAPKAAAVAEKTPADEAPADEQPERPEVTASKPVDPLEPIRKRCDGGDGEACLRVGRALESGSGVVVDRPGARAAFKSACDRGVLAACTKLGVRLAIDENDAAGAEALFRGACDGGEGAGCERLAVVAEAEAKLSLYAQACRAGDAPGCEGWGRLLVEGGNFELGIAMVQASCDRHWRSACDRVAELEKQRPKVAVEGTTGTMTGKANVTANLSATGEMSGKADASGKTNVSVELPTCVAARPDDCRIACEGGDGRACTTLGILHAYGASGVDKKLEVALDLFGQAVAKGDLRGHVHRGLLVEIGLGTKADLGAAGGHYQKACEGGDQLGCVHLGRLELDDQADAARARFEAACAAGEGQGCFELGVVFETGRGVATDRERARVAYDQGCTLGVVPSCGAWGRLTIEAAIDTNARAAGTAKLRFACDQHHARSCRDLKTLAVCEHGEVADCVARCKKGEAAVCALLGRYHAEGRFVAQSDVEARVWFEAAYEAKSCKER